MSVSIESIEQLKTLEGTELGHSEWLTITQDRIDLFAEATGDHQWIHVDVERAESGPFGGTIAHGFLTLSLMPTLVPQVITFPGFPMSLNYGCDRVRFPSPVRSGSQLRARVAVERVEEVAGGVQLALAVTFEIAGQEKPACVVVALSRHFVK